MNKVAFVTYGRIGDQQIPMGLTDIDGRGRKVFLLQNIGTDQKEELWQQFSQETATFDLVVTYLGCQMEGWAQAIKFIMYVVNKLPQSKILIVSCNCDTARKEAFLRKVNLTQCQRMECECGGAETMELLLLDFIDSGNVGVVS
jgi:hypothetical protein